MHLFEGTETLFMLIFMRGQQLMTSLVNAWTGSKRLSWSLICLWILYKYSTFLWSEKGENINSNIGEIVFHVVLSFLEKQDKLLSVQTNTNLIQMIF